MKKIILASGSPRRKKLLEQINLVFSVEVPGIRETYDPDLDPDRIVKLLSARKAKQVAGNHEDTLVIGADTIVVFQARILEKPGSRQQAIEMLLALSGNTHQVFTGVTMIKTDGSGNIHSEKSFFEKTDVTFGSIERREAEAYVDTGSPFDKAGGYGIQDDWGSVFIQKIKGDYYNVVGFPLHAFYQNLKSFAPERLPQSKKQTADER
ncbi:MAG: Maf family protein [Balneolaceae bacterium]|nr:Maf family protein [Balneolaceae bacterium]